jgi:hypothetical protein
MIHIVPWLSDDLCRMATGGGFVALDWPNAPCVMRLAEEGGCPRDGATGTRAGLHKDLTRMADENATKGKDWPQSPRGLSGQQRRLAPYLFVDTVEGWENDEEPGRVART